MGGAACVIIRAEIMACTQNSLRSGKGSELMSTVLPDCLIPCMDKKMTSDPSHPKKTLILDNTAGCKHPADLSIDV